MRNVSASQYKLYEDQCRRKWWLQYVHGLREPKRGFQGYGTVTHAVLERYLKADANGRDPATGLAVNLYPPGWTTAREKDGTTQTVSVLEAEQIQRLVPLAIQRGLIWRAPELAVEQEYWHDIPGLGVKEHGFIDYMTPDLVKDHKTAKTRRYTLNEQELNQDLQMRTYASVLRRVRLSHGMEDVPLEVGHNLFIKGTDKVPEDVFDRKVMVTPEQLIEHEAKVLTIVGGMLELQGVTEDRWKAIDVSEQLAKSDACNAYGGCPFRGICAGGETPAMYRMRMERVALAEKEREKRMAAGGGGSSMLSLLGKAAPVVPPVFVVAPPAAAPELPGPVIPFEQSAAINPVVEVSSVQGDSLAPAGLKPAIPDAGGAPSETSEQASGARLPLSAPEGRSFKVGPPWHNPKCVSCASGPTPGFASSGRGCKVCDASARRAGKQTSLDYNARLVDGQPTWDPGLTVAPTAPPAPPAPPATLLPPLPAADEPELLASLASTEPAVEEAPKKRRGRPPGSTNRKTAVQQGKEIHGEAERLLQLEDELATAIEKIAELGEQLQASEEALASGSPTIAQVVEAAHKEGIQVEFGTVKGFTLLIGAHVARGEFPDVVDFSDLMKLVKDGLALKVGKGYYEVGVWDRRDAIGANAAEIVRAYIPPGSWVEAARSATHAPDEQVLLSELRALADRVIEA